MPALSNQQHETFARNVAAGFNQTQAAKRSAMSIKAAHNVGSRVARRPEVQARISELRSKQDPEQRISRSWAEQILIDTIQNATESKDYGVVKNCVELACKLNGLLIDRRESYSEKVVAHVDAMDDATVNQMLSRYIGELPPGERQALLTAAPDVLGDVIEIEGELIEAPPQGGGSEA